MVISLKHIDIWCFSLVSLSFHCGNWYDCADDGDGDDDISIIISAVIIIISISISVIAIAMFIYDDY